MIAGEVAPHLALSCKAACSVMSLLVQSTVLDENAAVLADMRIIALLLGSSNWGVLSTCRLTTGALLPSADG